MARFWLLSVCVLLLWVLAPSAAASSLVQEDTFANLKAGSRQQVVLFYHSSSAAEAEQALMAMAEAATAIQQLSTTRHPINLLWRSCDGDLPVNRQEFAEAQFGQGAFIFTSTPVLGIKKYTGPLTGTFLAEYVAFLFADADEHALTGFTTESKFWDLLDLQSHPKPTVVFFENKADGCVMCDRLSRGFLAAATQFQSDAQWIKLDCSLNDDATKFCIKEGISNSLPVITLYTGEEKITFDEDEKSIRTWSAFLDNHPAIQPVATQTPQKQQQQQQQESVKPVKPTKVVEEAAVSESESESVVDVGKLEELTLRLLSVLEKEESFGRMNKALKQIQFIVKTQAQVLGM
jgi:hypothetical protein